MNGVAVSESISDDNGIARLCDAPLGLLSISVGTNRCGSMSINFLQRPAAEPHKLKVIFNNCAGIEWSQVGLCRWLIRLNTPEGQPIVGAVFQGKDDKQKPRSVRSDNWGRLSLVAGRGESLSGTVGKSGYLPETLSLSCSPGEPYDSDLRMTLNTSKK
jgi:hypothetical protein